MTTATWRKAARLWAVMRSQGRPGAPPDALDADMLLAAQALAEDATVVTTNAKHFEPLVAACAWTDVLPDPNAP